MSFEKLCPIQFKTQNLVYQGLTYNPTKEELEKANFIYDSYSDNYGYDLVSNFYRVRNLLGDFNYYKERPVLDKFTSEQIKEYASLYLKLHSENPVKYPLTPEKPLDVDEGKKIIL